MKKLVLLLSVFFSLTSFAQDYSWWKDKHDWDGVTHWSRHMILSPAYMGPNALPVPEIKDGIIRKNNELEISYENHFSEGDNTMDLFTRLFVPMFSNKVGLDIHIVPIEYYKMDTITRDNRISRDYDGKGISGGDFYIGTFIQIIENKKYLPDVLLTINMKTASGTNLEAASFTDSPGYFFDISLGKTYAINGKVLLSVRPYCLMGFYSWQTNGDNNRQDDTFLYGVGLNLNFNKFGLSNNIGGYRGYINNGDRPVVYRLCLNSNLQSIVNYKLQLQHGINDIPYTSLKVGILMNIDKLIKRKMIEND